MDVPQAVEKLMALQSEMSAYRHALSILYTDGVTIAPKGTTANRLHTMGILNEKMYRISTGEETISLLEFLDAHRDELDKKQARMVWLLLKGNRELKKIPMDVYLEYQKLLVEGDALWHDAKEKSDFALFEPVLSRIFELTKKMAAFVEPEKDPYDYWLDKYERGLTKASCDKFFGVLKERLVPLIAKIAEKPQVDDSFLHGDFPAWQQEKLAYKLMDIIGIDRDHCALSTTEHPFTTSYGSHYDVRITTNYRPHKLDPSMFSVIHEGGHAMYEMGSDDELAYTVLDGGASMSIHESQSRFYENICGRSFGFISRILPVIKECFPGKLDDVTPEQFYKAINKVEPSFIRIDADEVTYCMHVMVRYELEKQIFAGTLEVKDLPAAWNALMKEYLGIDVPDDKHGVLQDSHWANGNIGYFPSYALGSAYGAQFLTKMKKDIDVDKALAEADFTEINVWNREHIWKYGSLYEPNELLAMLLPEGFDPNIYADYLEKKYSEIYGL
ncbi:MAG: carboxypeptidase M32 [Eubacterium sp.]|nr:carboxypeptidase M32 [Eubacterium sp.]